ncbi:MAG TPA: hypothetical protein VLH35_05885 [Candidatus Acidoferrales bacterium]|nr:hypothetical protein [Candidatus Acidoferrales bacterium]
MDLAKTVLKALSRQPISRTELEQVLIRKGGTHATFEGILHYLVDGGFMQKSENKHLAKYIVTEKGCKLMEALK